MSAGRPSSSASGPGVDAMQRTITRLKGEKAELRAEVQALEASLLRAVVASEASFQREREAASAKEHGSEHTRMQQLLEAQDGIKRLQAQMEGLRETAREEQGRAAADAERRLEEQATRLNAEAGSVSEQIVEQLRTEYESRLFAASSEAERARIDLEQARSALADREATISSMRDEVSARRLAQALLLSPKCCCALSLLSLSLSLLLPYAVCVVVAPAN